MNEMKEHNTKRYYATVRGQEFETYTGNIR